jgi:hypothetical protein
LENLKKISQLEEMSVDGRVILKWMMGGYEVDSYGHCGQVDEN